ncbi:glycosyl hydrolase, family 18 [Leptospira kirschneri serovar Sokoine str. RM1]|uniref:glycosyl hydrolase family 18 protein n=1 Tax=Leptospira kirschneri TaxID=29507 RepID=UPI0002BF087C|nr:glycosyl hydrolase family 18 protein [Leptospira kirschneri]EMN24522.1 glycosyl hydrolase, family 18 [Leptospira kirschneri serovar Sokoine str. RM1]
MKKLLLLFFTFILLLSAWIGLYLFRIPKVKNISELINSLHNFKSDTKETEKKFLASTWSSDIVAMAQNIHLYDEIHPFLYTLEGGRSNTGNIKSIWSHEAQEIYIWTLKTISPKTKIIPTIFRWENDFEKVSDAIGLNGNVKIRDYHIQQILNEIDYYGYDGIDIDYEGMTCDKKESFETFLTLLSKELKKKNKLLSVAIHPKTFAEQPLDYFCKENGKKMQVDFYEAYRGQLSHDYEFLGKVADKVKIMAYELHPRKNAFPGPGPQAPSWWIEIILEYSTKKIPNSKLYMAIPTYGYDWPLNCDIPSKAVFYSRAQYIKTNWNPKIEEPTDVVRIFKNARKSGDWIYLRPYLYRHEGHIYDDPSLWYTLGGCDRVAFYINRRSFETKMNLLKKYKIRGFSFWQLIQDNDPEIHTYLKQIIENPENSVH